MPIPWPSSVYARAILMNLSTFMLGCYLSLNSVAPPLSVSHPDALNTSPGHKKIISFSLYGNDTLYTTGALRNAQAIPSLYPGWVPRFYIDETVPLPVVEKILSFGSEIAQVDRQEAWMANGRFWRYLALDDSEVRVVMFRDADSRITTRELEAVNTWIESGEQHHIMRDHPNHNRLIMPGQWSATTLPIRSRLTFRRAVSYFYSKNPSLDDSSSEDAFLTLFLWPLIKAEVLIHDAFHCDSPQLDQRSFPFPGPRAWHGDYIGRRVVESFDDNSEYFRNGQEHLNGGIVPIECRLSPEHLEG